VGGGKASKGETLDKINFREECQQAERPRVAFRGHMLGDHWCGGNKQLHNRCLV
jgi:hypothetical protein